MAKGTPGVKVEYTKTGKPVTHGRYSSYGNHGCRCPECTEAWKLNIRKYRKTHREEMNANSRRWYQSKKEAQQ